MSTAGIVADNSISADGTSMRGTMLAIPADLIEALGEGSAAQPEDMDTSLEWHFRDSSGSRWTIYDWKALGYMSREEIRASDDDIVFNIGGESTADPLEFRTWLQATVRSSFLELMTSEEKRADQERRAAAIRAREAGETTPSAGDTFGGSFGQSSASQT